VRSGSSTVVNLELGYKYKQFLAQLDVLNLFNSKDHDIDYFYPSRLPGEPAEGVADVHFHPIEPRTVRFYLSYKFYGAHSAACPHIGNAAGSMYYLNTGPTVARYNRIYSGAVGLPGAAKPKKPPLVQA
jgi:hypothetical protein